MIKLVMVAVIKREYQDKLYSGNRPETRLRERAMEVQ